MKDFISPKQIKYFKKNYQTLPHRNYITEKDYLQKMLYTWNFKFKECSKREIKQCHDICTVGRIGLYRPYEHFIWVYTFLPNVFKAVCLIHECCHASDFFHNCERYKVETEYHREALAFAGTCRIIENEIREDFPHIFQELKEYNYKFMKNLAAQHPTDIHVLACNKVLSNASN